MVAVLGHPGLGRIRIRCRSHLRLALTPPAPHPTRSPRSPPPHAAADVSKNVGVQGDEEAKGLLSAAAAKRKAQLNLIMNDEPGQRWSVDGFVDVVEWTR